MQIKNSFDAVTVKKIAKGAVITGFYAAAVFVLGMVNGMGAPTSVFNALILQMIVCLCNIYKEYAKGELENLK